MQASTTLICLYMKWTFYIRTISSDDASCPRTYARKCIPGQWLRVINQWWDTIASAKIAANLDAAFVRRRIVL